MKVKISLLVEWFAYPGSRQSIQSKSRAATEICPLTQSIKKNLCELKSVTTDRFICKQYKQETQHLFVFSSTFRSSSNECLHNPLDQVSDGLLSLFPI